MRASSEIESEPEHPGTPSRMKSATHRRGKAAVLEICRRVRLWLKVS